MSNISYLPIARTSAPARVNGNVPPRRRKNSEVRTREHLFPHEVEALKQACAKCSRYPARDKTLITVAYTHGLRVSELVALQWSQVDFANGTLAVSRLKGGNPATHHLTGEETRLLRALKRDWTNSRYVFCTERLGPMTTSTVRKMLTKLGRVAKLEVSVHPHMLRHACGYKLANDAQDTRVIQDYLGHASITSTVRYTQLSAVRFKGLFKD